MTGSKKKQILFLFNHDAAHQVAHIAGIMGELAHTQPALDVVAATGTPAIERQVRALIPANHCTAVRWVDLSLPNYLTKLLALPNKIAPVARIARLMTNIPLFKKADLVLSPERTCLRVRRKLHTEYEKRRQTRSSDNSRPPKFVFVPHGAGDRDVTYANELAQFDYFLLSGQKVIDEMIAHNLADDDQCYLIGYPKFDAVGSTPKVDLFDNDLPTIIYNPHFDPKLSSWFDFGPDFLKWVSEQSQSFNCVFAPHVMLFRKKVHISPEYKISRNRPEIPAEAFAADNIHIDTSSPRLFDMTYTNSADIYLGDVSSQVYEFLKEPRPCYFIDAAGQGSDAYQFWQNGPVVSNLDALAEQLAQYGTIGERYKDTQQKLFDYTINIDPNRTAAKRGADILLKLLQR